MNPTLNLPLLTQTGFLEATSAMADVDSAIVSVMGDTGTGKTHWALNAPGPVGYFDFDRGLHRALRVFTERGKKIYIKQYALPPNMTEDSSPQCNIVCDKFQADFRLLASKSSGIKTIIVDTGSDVWEMVRLAKLGKLSKVMPIHYMICNSIMSSLVSRCRAEKLNLLILHKVKGEYVNDKSTGKLIRHGWSEMGYQVDAEVILSREKKTKLFQAEYIKAASNPDLVGEVYSGEQCSFPAMMARMFKVSIPTWTDPATGIVQKRDSEAAGLRPPRPTPAGPSSTPRKLPPPPPIKKATP